LRGRLTIFPALAFAMASVAVPLAAHAADSARGSSCIDSRQLQDWRSPSPNVIYYRVNASDVFRLDLWTGSDQLKYSDAIVFANHRSPSRWVCTPADWDLRVSNSHRTFEEPLIIKSITKLTPDEIAAIPPQYRP
jgi:hypothetical protein